MQINNLNFHLKKLEKEEQTNPCPTEEENNKDQIGNKCYREQKNNRKKSVNPKVDPLQTPKVLTDILDRREREKLKLFESDMKEGTLLPVLHK